MQARMKNHILSDCEINKLLSKALVGRIATQNDDGFPYVVPVHFIYEDNKIYIHGLNKGQKIDNIKSNDKVCFEVDEMLKLLLDENPCDVNTEYNSVIVFGEASIIEDENQKVCILKKIVEKYVPKLAQKDLPSNMIKAIGVIEISVLKLSGKYYK